MGRSRTPLRRLLATVTKRERSKSISSDGTEINKVLRAAPELPERLRVFFDEDIEEASKTIALTSPYLTQIVSSQLDADRFDYLLRDSHATGPTPAATICSGLSNTWRSTAIEGDSTCNRKR